MGATLSIALDWVRARRDRMPETARANYKGSWHSHMVGMENLCGVLDVALPTETMTLDDGEDFKAWALVSYGRSSPRSRMCSHLFDMCGAVASAQEPAAPHLGGRTITLASSDGNVTFETLPGTVHTYADLAHLRGTYTIDTPPDRGTFSLTATL